MVKASKHENATVHNASRSIDHRHQRCGAINLTAHRTPLGQSQFRIGEEIGLKAVFEMTHATDAASSGQPGWMVMFNGHDRSVLGFTRDRFVVTPESGTRDPWSYRLHEGIAYAAPAGFASATSQSFWISI